jgi:ubiquinone biosynthesis protein UbiJ
VQISGDLGVAKQVENLIEKIDFDGEELFSKIVGDASAHVVFYNLGTIRNKLLATVGKAKFDLIDYIQYEKTLVPSSGDFKNFVDQMSSLSKRLESVEHQIKTIEKTGRRAT